MMSAAETETTPASTPEPVDMANQIPTQESAADRSPPTIAALARAYQAACTNWNTLADAWRKRAPADYAAWISGSKTWPDEVKAACYAKDAAGYALLKAAEDLPELGKGECELCGDVPAYVGARFCGAGCTARWEMGQRPAVIGDTEPVPAVGS